MVDSKKYNGSTWQHSLRKLTTATEAVENPLYSDGTAITSYTIKGNTVQNGTPTPDNPVDANGVGVRTENLYNSAETSWELGILDDQGHNTGSTSSHFTKNLTRVSPNTNYFLSGTIFVGDSGHRIYFYDNDKNWISRSVLISYTNGRFTTPSNCAYIQIQIMVDVISTSDWMLNTGSEAKPYEPYGYKTPISSGGVTTNIYLGITQTVRQIKKLVLTGQENWVKSTSYGGSFYFPNFANGRATNIALCTHLPFTTVGTYIKGSCTMSYGALNLWFPQFDEATTLEEFKAYLNAQYANGTPVIVWCGLKTPETGIVNEPLMKIGNYADTVSNTTAIPTTEGANSITVDTTVQPSEFTATWTGWHDAAVKEWDASQWIE